MMDGALLLATLGGLCATELLLRRPRSRPWLMPDREATGNSPAPEPPASDTAESCVQGAELPPLARLHPPEKSRNPGDPGAPPRPFVVAGFIAWLAGEGLVGAWVEFPILCEMADSHSVDCGRARAIANRLRRPLMAAGCDRAVVDRRAEGGTKVVCYRVPSPTRSTPGTDCGTGGVPAGAWLIGADDPAMLAPVPHSLRRAA